MLDSASDIESFTEFYNAGGVQTPENTTTANTLSESCTTIKTTVSALISDEIDYSVDGLDDYVTLVETIASECETAITACTALTDYLEDAADPVDMIQVAQGVEVLRKLAGTTDSTDAAPSMAAITSKTELQALSDAIDSVNALLPDLVSLMETINEEIAPTSTTAEDGTTTSTQPALSDDTSEQAQSETRRSVTRRSQAVSTQCL